MTDSERWFSISLNHFIWTGLVMTLPSSGEISLAAINVELGKASNTQASFNDTDVRNLLAKTAGAIAIADAYGKSKSYTSSTSLTPATFLTNFNVRTFLLANNWDGVTPVDITVTVPSDTVLGSTTTTLAAFETGVLPTGSIVRLVNNGIICGQGGSGGSGGSFNQSSGVNGSGSAGDRGGPAIRTTVTLIITNKGSILGGGGGGGGGGAYYSWPNSFSGCGGGGGRGYTNSSGGPAGSQSEIGQAGNSGSGGTYTEPGNGGSGPSSNRSGGTGGGLGLPGSSGISGNAGPGGGSGSGGLGGPAGYAIIGISYVSWIAYGKVAGPIQ